jgi:hypothetical protein
MKIVEKVLFWFQKCHLKNSVLFQKATLRIKIVENILTHFSPKLSQFIAPTRHWY